jgi:hypothetical protein
MSRLTSISNRSAHRPRRPAAQRQLHLGPPIAEGPVRLEHGPGTVPDDREEAAAGSRVDDAMGMSLVAEDLDYEADRLIAHMVPLV